MPTFGHLFYGFCLLLPLLYYTRNKFSYKIAFVFIVNNIFGPDIVGLYFVTPFHSILGFLLLAILYSLVFSYGSRFSLVRSEKGFPLKFEDSGIRELNWLNAYCVTAAGGLSHFFIDQFFHNETNMTIWQGITISLEEMLEWSGLAYHTVSVYMLIGETIVVITLLLSLFFFMKGFKDTAKLFAIFTALSVVLLVFISTEIFGGEREYAALLCSVVYVLAPLFLLLYVARNVEEKPNEVADVPKIERTKLLKIVAIIGIVVGLFYVLYSSLAIFMADLIASLVGTSDPAQIASIQVLGIYYIIFALMILIGSIGLFFKMNIFRYLTIIGCCYFLIFGFPLAIAFFLCEKEVKEMFNKRD